MARAGRDRIRRRIEEECGAHSGDLERFSACVYRVLLSEGLLREPLRPRVRRALGLAWQLFALLWTSLSVMALGPLGAAYIATGNGVPEPIAVWAVALPLMILGAAIWYRYIWEGAVEAQG